MVEPVASKGIRALVYWNLARQVGECVDPIEWADYWKIRRSEVGVFINDCFKKAKLCGVELFFWEGT